MTNRWKVLTYPMSNEHQVLEHVKTQLLQAEPESIAVLPEYLAYTEENSKRALEMLIEICRSRSISVITTLNLVPFDLPYAEKDVNYNVLTIVTKEGKVYTPQAKITPQSFERVQYQANFPKINVGNYDYLNHVMIEVNGKLSTAYFVICSDVYCLMAGVEKSEELKADYCIVPGNFGNGAEKAVRRTLERFRSAGLFHTTIFSNPYQIVKDPSKTPLVQEATDLIESDTTESPQALTDWDRVQLVKQNVAIYPDEQIPSFVQMAKLTLLDEGRMTVSMSRFPVTVQLGIYPETIRL